MIIDNVKVRVRTHDPNGVYEKEFEHIEAAIGFLEGIRFKCQHSMSSGKSDIEFEAKG